MTNRKTWTAHGWWIGEGHEPVNERTQFVAKCGGPNVCAQCKAQRDGAGVLLAQQVGRIAQTVFDYSHGDGALRALGPATRRAFESAVADALRDEGIEVRDV